jgi:predicted transcriptional regulator
MMRTDNLTTTDSENKRIAIVANTTNIVAAMISANFIPASVKEVTEAIASVSIALNNIGEHTEVVDIVMTGGVPIEHAPAVSVRKSLSSKDHIISMIDGKPYKMLRRHIGMHGLTPETYRERYNLRSDYPMVAENYAKQRRELAVKIGLGKNPAQRKSKSKA